MSSVPLQRVPWYRRLSLRMAAVLGLAMLAFDVVSGRIFGVVADWFKLDSYTHVHDGAQCSDLIRSLLFEAQQGPSGAFYPSAEAQGVVQSELGDDYLYAWTDRDLHVIAASPASGLVEGDALDPVAVHRWWQPHPVPYSGVDPDLELGDAVPDRLSGWFLLGDAYHGLDRLRPVSEADSGGQDEELIPIEPEEFDRLFDRVEWVATFVSRGLVALLALFMGGLVSFFVTRRIRRLALAASAVSPLEESSSGTVNVSGGDEISVLARALQDSQVRVANLVSSLDDRDSKRREWTAQVSHDLRTPLTALRACLERANAVLQELPEGTERRELAKLVAIAGEDTDRVRAFSDDLLEIARLDVSDALHWESVLPEEVAERAVRGMLPLAEKLGIELSLKVEGTVDAIPADGHRLMRVLENLLRNSLHHGRRRVELRLSGSHTSATFAVTDDGPGFPETDGRIELESLSDSARREGPGFSRLGLTVARKIVEAHGGTLRIENRPEGGACVSFELWSGVADAADSA